MVMGTWDDPWGLYGGHGIEYLPSKIAATKSEPPRKSKPSRYSTGLEEASSYTHGLETTGVYSTGLEMSSSYQTGLEDSDSHPTGLE